MNIALIIGKDKSVGVPGKNVREIVGRPAAEYAFIAAKYAGCEPIFVSTDSAQIAEIGRGYGAIHIERPPELAMPDSLTEDALLHAYEQIKAHVGNATDIKTISLLFCNNPAINVELLRNAISTLHTEDFDSCFSVVKYDMFSPTRARKINATGEIQPFIDLTYLGNVSSIRDSQGSVYFCDLSIQVMKPTCFENMHEGQLPFKWQGKKSKAIETDFGFDIDAEWQYVVIEYWLRKHGYSETTIPWSMPC